MHLRPHWIQPRCFALLSFWVCLVAPRLWADPEPAAAEKTKAATTDADDPAKALKKFFVAPGLKVDLFAAEPMIQNPVSLSFDEQGRVFVVETFRRRSSVFDIRNHSDWLEDDFSFRTVQDRINFLKKTLTPNNQSLLDKTAKSKRGSLGDFNHDGKIDWRDLEVESERIRLLTDTDGDGRADQAVTFADGFNTIVSGVH